MISKTHDTLPLIAVGPLLRRCTPAEVVFWWIATEEIDCRLHVAIDDIALAAVTPDSVKLQCFRIGKRAFVYCLLWSPTEPLPQHRVIYYDIEFNRGDTQVWLTQLIPGLVYPGQNYPSFVLDLDIHQVLHGSCRKPHHPADDALVQVDRLLQTKVLGGQRRPNYLMLTGDQVYADDVAGPTLWAIHQLIGVLGLFDEPLEGATVSKGAELYSHPHSFYQRDQLLPKDEANENVARRFWRGKRKPIFTTVNGRNHLITFAEVMAQYILVWSPSMWECVSLEKEDLTTEFQQTYASERRNIEQFAAGLGAVRRALAHLPTYMIFDDHDVTDDWNLTRGWEESSYGHPFSKRIIGNALMAYLLCQGWGNNPSVFNSLEGELARCLTSQGLQNQDDLINTLLSLQCWHYRVPTDPPTLVLDTRTQRWRSESSLNKPSGLMDWESLCELQQQLIGEKSVILVSAAPIFGVKLIEAIQKIFTFFGKSLMVDAENWMAHKGTANVILNIFRHQRTPPLFIILSGDVHYSFVYDVKLRFSRSSPRICQITASGIKNAFPERLLYLLDRFNRWLFHRNSPLNWLTQRRDMSITPRKPEGKENETLVNTSGIGILNLESGAQRIETLVLAADGRKIAFENKRLTVEHKSLHVGE